MSKPYTIPRRPFGKKAVRLHSLRQNDPTSHQLSKMKNDDLLKGAFGLSISVRELFGECREEVDTHDLCALLNRQMSLLAELHKRANRQPSKLSSSSSSSGTSPKTSS